jgi:hypothetical protein
LDDLAEALLLLMQEYSENIAINVGTVRISAFVSLQAGAECRWIPGKHSMGRSKQMENLRKLLDN